MSTTTETATRTPSLATRQAKWKRDYRKAAEATENARILRDTSVVNFFRSLPDSEVTVRKTANGEQRTTKPVSDNARAKATLVALAVSVDDKGKTQDIFGLTPQRVVQIVKAYHRAETVTMSSTTNGSLSPILETDRANALTVALTEATKHMGDKGTDALAETLAKDLADTPAGEIVAAAEAATRDAISKAKAAKAAKKDDAKPESDVRPVVAISAALDSLESALSAGASDLDPQQKAFLLQRLETLAKSLS
jgi:hypothetical protein